MTHINDIKKEEIWYEYEEAGTIVRSKIPPTDFLKVIAVTKIQKMTPQDFLLEEEQSDGKP